MNVLQYSKLQTGDERKSKTVQIDGAPVEMGIESYWDSLTKIEQRKMHVENESWQAIQTCNFGQLKKYFGDILNSTAGPHATKWEIKMHEKEILSAKLFLDFIG
jgi:hypothetical protein